MISRRTLIGSLAAPLALGGAATAPVIGFAGGTYGMKPMKTEAALRALAEIGYDGVEPCLIAGWPADPAATGPADRREIRKLLDGLGLGVPAMLESLMISNAPGRRAQNLERLKLAVAFGNDIAPANPPPVETVIGGKTADWDKVKDRMADELRDWARVAEDARTTVCFKPHAAHAVHNAERAIWLIKAVGSKRLRVCYDYSHFYVEGYGLAASLKELFPYIAFIAVKDSKGTPEKHQYLLPGDGKTDYLAYFRLLKELRYSGWVGVEVSAMIHREPGYEPVPTAKLCYERLAPLFKKAGIRRPPRQRRG